MRDKLNSSPKWGQVALYLEANFIYFIYLQLYLQAKFIWNPTSTPPPQGPLSGSWGPNPAFRNPTRKGCPAPENQC